MAPIFGVTLVVLVGMAGSAIDVGRVMWVKRQLQSSADAAALAGAMSVAYDSNAATTAATEYSGLSGKKNMVQGATSVSFVGAGPIPKCLSSVKVPACTPGTGKYNGISVTQQAIVPMYFLGVVGFSTMTPRATALASARGGAGRSLDVVVVLDATASMKSLDPNCSVIGATKMDCAKAGAAALLSGLNPALDQVSFMVFPGVTANGVLSSTTCGKTFSSSDVASYKAVAAGTNGSTYMLGGLSNTFAVNGEIDTTSVGGILVGKSLQSKCQGITPEGGVGTYFADAIDAAQKELEDHGRAKSQKVMVILSDGDASASSGNMPSGKANNQCQQAIARSKVAAGKGTWVYSVAYAASTTSGCSTDTANYVDVSGISVNMKNVKPCATMQNIASDSTKFFADGTGSGCKGTGGTNSDLISLFKSISVDLSMPRLLPENTV